VLFGFSAGINSIGGINYWVLFTLNGGFFFIFSYSLHLRFQAILY